MERMTQIDPRLCGGRPFVVQSINPDNAEIPEPSIIWERGDAGILVYGGIIDHLFLLEEDRYKPATTAEQPEPMTREKILEAAKRCVCTDRNHQYGGPERSFTAIAEMWTAYMHCKNHDITITAHDAAMMLALFKAARVTTSETPKADTYTDLAGYAACAGEIACGGEVQKQYKRKETSLYNATHKPNRSEVEIGNILETLDVLEYLIELVEGRQ